MNALLTPVLDRDELRGNGLREHEPRDDFGQRDSHDTSALRPTRRPPATRRLPGRPPLSVVQQDPDPELRLTTGADDDPGLLSAKLALCVIEILAGARPLDQLGRWVSDSVYVQLLRRTVIASRSREVTGDDARRPRVRVGEPMINHLGETIVDAVVMIHQPARSRAVALRLERHRNRWRATAISVL
jgi:hypothetical protein